MTRILNGYRVCERRVWGPRLEAPEWFAGLIGPGLFLAILDIILLTCIRLLYRLGQLRNRFRP
jgi:hypothetical protein